MATYEPTIRVEAAFGYGALDDSPMWTAIDVVQSGNIRRGRTVEFDNFPSGSCSLQLVDDDRSFDPLNSAGAYAGSLLPNVPIRVVASHGGTDYPRFYGYADGWQVSPRHNTAFVGVAATDGLKIIANIKLPQSVYDQVLIDDGPHFLWHLGEADGATAADSSGNLNDGRYLTVEGLARAEPALVPYANQGSVTSSAVLTNLAVVSDSASAALTSSPPCSVEMWLQSEAGVLADNGTLTCNLFEQFDPTTEANRLRITYASSVQRIVVRHGGLSGDKFWSFDLPFDLDDGRVHHLVVSLTTSTVTLYADGVENASTSSALAGLSAGPAGIALGTPADQAPNYSAWPGTIDDVSYWDVALTSTQVDAHRAAAFSPWDGDLTGARIERILDLIGWPASLRELDAGEVTLGPADLAGVSALEYLQLIAQSEGGRLFMGNDGSVVFHDAARVRADTTATATFSDDGSETPYAHGSGNYTLDDRLIFNRASIQRKYGLPQAAVDTTSVTTYGPREKSQTGLLMQNDAQARHRADQLVFRYKDPQIRLAGIQVEPEVMPANWPTNLGLELGDHIAFEIQTAGTLARETLQLDLEQISEQFTPSRYQFTYVGSPRDPNIDNYFTWGSGTAARGWGTGVWA